ncbi:MAG TPA: hypothetical protein VFQ54_02885, partial [Thermomicrobiales bacterium]|nr:hypothetical protein [Thermomicrobiales bacterium]
MTSLDWYREALHESSHARRTRIAQWFRGWPFLKLHLSVFAFAIVVLFALNVARTSGGLWIGTVALAWLAVIVIHAAVGGIIWALDLLRQDPDRLEAEDLPWTAINLRPLGGGGGGRGEPQDIDYRMARESAPAVSD